MEQEVKNQPQPMTQDKTEGMGGSSSLMHDFIAKDPTAMPIQKVIFSVLLVVLFGLGSGFVLAKVKGNSSSSGKGKIGSMALNPNVQKGKTYGSTDTKTYKDSVEGKMAEGGVEGEGQFHLVRPGGDSQNVYMTSSTVDLSEFVGRQVKVWGQTQTAQKVGWLMDVGGVKVLD